MKTERTNILWTGTQLFTAGLALLGGQSGSQGQPMSRDLFDGSGHVDAMAKTVKRFVGHKPICLVNMHMPRDAAIADFSNSNHLDYARKHGYSYVAFRGRISDERFLNPARGSQLTRYGGGLTWQKLTGLAATSVQMRGDNLPMCEWLMWLDTDTAITQPDVRVEDIIGRFATPFDKHVILSRDATPYNDSFINSGVFFVKNSWPGRAFLLNVEVLYEKHKEGPLTDQIAIQEVAFGLNPYSYSMLDREFVESQLNTQFALAPQDAFNSYMPNLQDPASLVAGESAWQPCSFIVHMAGRSRYDKVSGMRDALSKNLDCPVETEKLDLSSRASTPAVTRNVINFPKHQRQHTRSKNGVAQATRSTASPR